MSTYPEGHPADEEGRGDRPQGPAQWGPPAYGPPDPYRAGPPSGQEQQAYPPPSAQQPYPQQPYGTYPMPPGPGYAAVPPPMPRPGGVTAAAVLGFVYGAFGVLWTLGLLLVAAVAGRAASNLDDGVTGLAGLSGLAAGVLVFLGVLALAWTVVMIWGAVRALSGRSRVMLLVGSWIAVVVTGLLFLASLGNNGSTAGGIVSVLVFCLVSILMVVVLSNRRAKQFFATARARRG